MSRNRTRGAFDRVNALLGANRDLWNLTQCVSGIVVCLTRRFPTASNQGDNGDTKPMPVGQ
jgi:hypothetical protein